MIGDLDLIVFIIELRKDFLGLQTVVPHATVAVFEVEDLLLLDRGFQVERNSVDDALNERILRLIFGLDRRGEILSEKGRLLDADGNAVVV